MATNNPKKQVATKEVSKTKTVTASKEPTNSTPKPIKLGKIDKAYTKNELLANLATYANLDKKAIALVLDGLKNLIFAHLKKGSAENFVLPGLLKIAAKSIAAKPARMGRNPATGEAIKLKAKPASRKIKINALKLLKEII